MKKAIFLVGLISVCFIPPASSQIGEDTTSVESYYKDNPYAKDFLYSQYLITKTEAFRYINAFKKHKYKVFGKKKLNNPWSYFEPSLLKKIILHNQTDSLFFFLAAYPRKAKVEKKKKRHPFVVMEAKPKSDTEEKGKGSADFPPGLSKPLYFKPVDICPPPNQGCRIP